MTGPTPGGETAGVVVGDEVVAALDLLVQDQTLSPLRGLRTRLGLTCLPTPTTRPWSG